MKLAIIAFGLVAIAATAAQAQTCTPMPAGMMPQCQMPTPPRTLFSLPQPPAAPSVYTTMPLGGGWSTTTGPNGFRATTVPMGDGMFTTTVNPGMR